MPTERKKDFGVSPDQQLLFFEIDAQNAISSYLTPATPELL